MKKGYILVAVIVLAIVVLGILNISSGKTIDWTESFNEKSNKPYGVSVLYKELDKLFENDTIKTVYHTPYNYLSANSEYGYGDHIAHGTYMIIGNTDYLDDYSIEELLLFVSEGNTLFISDYYTPVALMDSLGVDIDFNKNSDSISHLYLNYNSKLNTKIDRNEGNYFFADYGLDATVLGTVKETDSVEERANFLKIPYEDGTVYFHLEPKVFTNYNVLKDDTYKYVESAMSYLPGQNLYFDSYTKYFNSYYGDAEQKSDLGWFLEQSAFKWAWYWALFFMLLFIVFNAKRRQRIVQVIKPLSNTTVEFVKTISNLYYETQDHKNLVHKKITYFLEKVRTDYNLDTSLLDEEFIDRLAAKSGKKKEQVAKLINLIKRLHSKTEFFEDNLKELNKHIEDFYHR